MKTMRISEYIYGQRVLLVARGGKKGIGTFIGKQYIRANDRQGHLAANQKLLGAAAARGYTHYWDQVEDIMVPIATLIG